MNALTKTLLNAALAGFAVSCAELPDSASTNAEFLEDTLSRQLDNVLSNGDFETGALSSWQTSGTTSIVNKGCHGGEACARVGGAYGSADSAIQQTVNVPATRPSLTLWHQSVCRDSVQKAWLNIELRSTSGQLLRTLLSDTCTKTGNWAQLRADLTAFAGQSVVLVVNNHDDLIPWSATNALIDDVAISGSHSTDTQDPTVALTAPANDTTVSRTVSVTATASDNIGVDRVDFTVNGMSLGSDTSAPYGIDWNTTGVADGQHSLRARAYDAAGNSADATVNVVVKNGQSGATGVGKDGGKVDRLRFAVIGDTRPAIAEDTANYPTAIIEKIYSQLNTLNPKPQFAIGTGDYVFALPGSAEAQRQLDIYSQATKKFSNIVFTTVGNHECTGQTASNCTDGTNATFNAYMNTLIRPLGKTNPYFTIPVSGTSGDWTSKFVFIACNAWDATQRTWLENELSQATTHTFVLRHQPSSDDKGPCTRETNSIIARHPYSMLLVGHEHTYERVGTRELIVGNGGAPLSSNVPFGYAIVEQTNDGFTVSQYDYATAMPVSSFTVPF
jgi:hypothetical protein